MNKHEIYVNIKNRLSTLALSQYWPGFHAYPFTLSEENTAIELEIQNIAVLKLENETDIDFDLLAADLVCEMFRVFQKDMGETRFSSDLKLMNCPMDEDYFGLKQYENSVLANIIPASPEEKQIALREFFGVRELRSRISDCIEQEYMAETGDGMAIFVGGQALMELSPIKFRERIEDYCRKIGSYNEGLFDLRHSCGISGALLMFIAADAGFDFRHEIGSTDVPVSKIIEQMCGCELPDEVVCDERVRLGLKLRQA